MASKLINAGIILFIVLTVLTVIFEPELGNIFTGMLAAAIIYYLADRSRRFELERKQERIKSLVLASAGFVVLIIISNIIFPFFGKAIKLLDFSTTLQAMSEVRNAILFSQIKPALAGSLPLNLFTLGIIIPFIETIWLIIAFEFLLDWTQTNPSFRSGRTWLILAVLASLFTILHFSALGVKNDVALASVFVFTIITLILAIIEGQMLAAILFHVIANSSSLITTQFSQIFQSPILVTGVVAAAAVYLLTRPFVRRVFTTGS